ncbi:GyrI-like domain-containing protein [Flavobacterium sp. K5-23]|uniref:GyrI-like domain-containing protein n=1 Tax=Flavobacterium sp. K5-23 TaxID=2746225 RepID=UPI00200CB721|nr:GyrI-like domain-containing protein [Flavobacterium sp. K5-23]UQD57581.1 GyrI-like domain-containing protein [Flavobacterium sp. K5-23]
MIPRIESLIAKKLIGKSLSMSVSQDKTQELWQSFMPRRNEIENRVGTEFYSMQMYPHTYFANFNPNTEFEKWATVEVTDFDTVPNDMKSFILNGGQYAVFLHKGSNNIYGMFEYIFTTWLPNSEYDIDDRPHFEILGDKYKRNEESSEEEIWIPIKNKELKIDNSNLNSKTEIKVNI